MKNFLKKHKEVLRWISFIPMAALIPDCPINFIFLSIQLTAFFTMFYIGWDYESDK